MKWAIALLLPVLALSASAAWASPSTSAQQHEDDLIERQLHFPPVSFTSEAQAPPTLIRRSSATKRVAALVLPDTLGRVWKLGRAERKWLAPQLRKSLSVVAFFKNPKHRWVLAPNKAKCWSVAWQRSCTLARAKLQLHHRLAEAAEYRLKYELPLINDWRTAVRYIQRIYPRTESWILYISDREGGYGPWVWYGGRTWGGYHVGDDFLGHDTVGGWMQFRFSTFAPYYRHMVEDMRARGFTLPRWPDRGGPAEYQPWLDPLAQALTAGYMKYYGKEGCHWC